MFKAIKKILLIVCLLIAVFAAAHFALAADFWGGDTNGEAFAEAASLPGAATDLRVIIANIIRIALGFLGILAVLIIIYAGWLWMTAGGEADKIEKAKKILTGGLIGLVLILSSFAIASFILNKLIEATGGGPGGGSPTCDPACSGAAPYCCSGACQANPCLPGGSSSFYVASTVPNEGAPSVIRNVVIRYNFNTGVNSATVNPSTFMVENVTDSAIISGERKVIDNRIEFVPETGTCPANACGADRCLPANKNIRVTAAAGSIVSLGGLSLVCTPQFGDDPCIINFTTNDAIDCARPALNILDNGQVCLDSDNLFGFTATDDSGVSSVEFNDSNGGSAFLGGPAPIRRNCPGPDCTIFNETDTVIWRPTAALGYSPATNYTITAKAEDYDSNTVSDSVTYNLRAAHCCNAVKDADEIGIDCGGSDCGACDGAQCDIGDANPATCVTPDNSKCASNFCDDDTCLCQSLPVITGVFPVGGFCDNDNNRACLANSDCTAGVCNQTVPNGAVGNFVTIIGRNFGATPGQVSFNGINAALASAPDCDNSWSDRQIIAVVPAGGASGPVKVTTAADFFDDSTANPALPDFLVNTINRPGLCQLSPTEGMIGTTVNYSGIKLDGNRAYFGNLQQYVPALGSSFTAPSAGSAQVPNIQIGRTTSFVMNGNVFSNYLGFTKNPEPYSGPIISSFSPTEEELGYPIGQYVTISGSGFGDKKGASEVYFGNSSTGEKASYDFPQVCADSIWSDKQVIVKVPSGIRNGDYIITMKIVKAGGGFWDDIDTSGLTPSKFRVNLTQPLAPSLCRLDPLVGQPNSQVSLWGEYFESQDANSKVRFQLNHDQSGAAITYWGIDNTAPGSKKPDKAVTTVPLAAVTGPVKAVKNSPEVVGNGLNFKVGTCQEDSECGSGNLCCSAGTPYAGQCQAGTDEQEACFPEIKSCVYEWNFSTSGTAYCAVGQTLCGRSCCNPGDSCDATYNYGAGKCDDIDCPIGTVTCGDDCCSAPASCENGVCQSDEPIIPCDGDTATAGCQADDSQCPVNYTCNITSCFCEPDDRPEACSGYGGSLQGCYGQMCPNSPGQCSSYAGGPVSTGVNCDDAACQALTGCSDAGGNNLCSYDLASNKCSLDGAACQDSPSQSITMKFDAEGANPEEDFNTGPPNFTPTLSVVAEGTNKVYQAAGRQYVFSNEYIPIDVNKKYYIFGRFKSVGDGKACIKTDGTPYLTPTRAYIRCSDDASVCLPYGATCERFNSRIYFGLALYNKDKNLIRAEQILRKGNPDTNIVNLTNNQITVDANIVGWNAEGTTASVRSLAFYYDGDAITKVPDSFFIWYTTPYSVAECGVTSPPDNCYYSTRNTQGVYQGAGINGSTVINLNTPLPAAIANNIRLGTTVVMNHYYGGTYLYSAASNRAVPWEWENLAYNQGGITGEGFSIYEGGKQFRIGTEYAKVVLLLNYNQFSDQEVVFDDITFAEQQCNTVNGINILQISSGGVSCPGGTYLDTNGWCTIGTPGNPDTCVLSVPSLCPSGFICQGGECLTNQGICSSDSSCQAGVCEKTAGASCECCCRIGLAAQDCCYPLDCTGTCGADTSDDGAGLGQCTGCADAGTTQAQHNAACNCLGSSGKFCQIDKAHPTGVCSDCAQISDATVCSEQGIGVCCVDAENSNACRSGTAPYVSGEPGDTNNYCAYYECQTDEEATCSGPVAFSDLPVYRTEEACNNSCALPPQFGESCGKTVPGPIDVCDESLCSNFSCLNEDGSGPAAPDSCGICCCDPGAADDQCAAIDSKLNCVADKGNCSGSDRGLCCGCAKDSECGDPLTVGCGSDTCCQARPKVIDSSISPTGSNVCRNTMIQATFDQTMQIDSFAGNVIVAGDYGASLCPVGTEYLTAAYQPTVLARIKSWLAKVPLVNKIFVAEAQALTGNFCTVLGSVSGHDIAGDRSVLEFKLQKLLEPGRIYYVIIKGDSDVNDGISNGVLSQAGIGMRGDGYGSDNPVTFNGVAFNNAKVWSFTTMPKQAANNGVCVIDHIKVEPASYLFQTNQNNTDDDNEDDSDTFNKIKDSDLVYWAGAVAADGSILNPLPRIYNWTWSWSSGANNIFDFVSPSGGSLVDNEKLLRAKSSVTEGKSIITATATLSAGGTGSFSGAALAYLMVCANPWPAPNSLTGYWTPWRDSTLCTINGTGCYDTGFEFYYCRDAGAEGTADDLPAIKSDEAIIRGSSGDILKEFYFFRESVPLTVANFTASALPQGEAVSSSWNPVLGAAGYKVYYGTASGKYTDSIDVGKTTSKDITGLTNGRQYYFVATAYNDKKAESAYSNEVAVTPADISPPAVPSILSIGSTAAGAAIIAWQANDDDTASYKIYYGGTSNLGATVSVSKNECSSTVCTATISGLNSDITYYFAVTALDAKPNESAKSLQMSLPIFSDATLCRAGLIQILNAAGRKRDELKTYLLKVTGSNCSACYACNWGRTLDDPACVAQLAKTYTNLGFANTPKDPWGNAYLIDENELENPSCLTKDVIFSTNPVCGGYLWVPFYTDTCR